MYKDQSSSSTLSKAEYLKKYLSGDKPTISNVTKTKKLKKKSIGSRVRVVDDDATAEIQPNLSEKIMPAVDEDASDVDEANFKPTIADFIDERPEEVQILEQFSTSGKWKSVGDGPDRMQIAKSITMSKRPNTGKVESKPIASMVVKEEEESTAGVIILPDVRKSTAMKKSEEAAAVQKQKEEERQEQYSKWSKGLAQIAQQKERAEEMVKEMAKPLARYVDDEDLERTLKDKDRIGDPMLAFKKGKQGEGDGASTNLGKRPHRGPPNRFNIPPGLRWDGVDRSNGFERDLFISMADRKTVREEEHIYSVEDW